MPGKQEGTHAECTRDADGLLAERRALQCSAVHGAYRHVMRRLRAGKRQENARFHGKRDDYLKMRSKSIVREDSFNTVKTL